MLPPFIFTVLGTVAAYYRRTWLHRLVVRLRATWLGRRLARLARFASLTCRDKRIPRWLRPVLVIACLPIPGPVDNAVQVAVVAYLLMFHRPVVRDAWRDSRLTLKEPS